LINRNSNIKVAIRGGNGSLYQRNRASTLAPNSFMSTSLPEAAMLTGSYKQAAAAEGDKQEISYVN